MADSGVIDIQRSAAELINHFAIVLRTAHIHTTTNVAFTKTADKFIVLIKDVSGTEDEIIVQLRGDFFYINEERVRYKPEYLLNYDYLTDKFKKIELGTIVFKKEISLEDLKIFTQLFIETDFLGESFETLDEKMTRIPVIKLKRLEKIDHETSMDVRRRVRKTYFNSVFYIKGLINKVKSGEEVDIKRVKRVVTSVVNTIMRHEQTLLGMTTIKDYDEYTAFHSTNVSILSVALGQRLGLNRKMLITLGISALFHDLGKINVPNEILNKSDRLVDNEWRIIKKHPAWGVKSILKMRDIDELTIQAALVAFEHHMNLDHSGYPRLKTPVELCMFSRIVSIVDRYDAMTSSRVYSKDPMSSDKALSILMEKSRDKLDPLLLRFFINLVGVYPIGILVKLDSNELGLVFENNQQSLLRPRVMLLTDSKGNWIEGQVVDLSEVNDRSEYIRTITKTMDPQKYGINTAEYLL